MELERIKTEKAENYPKKSFFLASPVQKIFDHIFQKFFYGEGLAVTMVLVFLCLFNIVSVCVFNRIKFCNLKRW